MKKYFLKIKRFFTNKLNIIYHKKGNKESKIFKLPIYIVAFIVFCLITSLIGGFYVSNYYYSAYKEKLEEIENLKNIREDNIKLKNRVYHLAEETDKITERLNNIKLKQKEFADEFIPDNKNLLFDADKMKLETVFAYNDNLILQGLPLGGSELRLHYRDTEELISEMQQEIIRIKNNISTAEKNRVIIKDRAVKLKKEMRNKPSIWPLAASGRISANYGWRYHPILKRQEFHDGLDIAVNYNTPVMTAADGKVIYAGWSGGYGRLVKVDHGNKYTTYYAHLNKIAVKAGEKVKKGQLIAYSGNSGRSTGPHLHYEVRENGIPENPRKFIGY